MKKIIIFILCLILSTNIKALELNKVYIDSELDIAGNINVKEVIEINNLNENLDLNLFYKDTNLKEENTFDYSIIHNSNRIELKKIGVLNEKYDINNLVNEKIDQIEYETIDENGYYHIKINKNYKKTYLYLEYIILINAVKYNDIAEVYYKYLNNFNYDINSIKIIFRLPFDSEIFDIYPHGKNFSATKDINKPIVLCEANNIKKDNNFDLRVVFDKDIFAISINKEKVLSIDAYDSITKIENKKLKNTKINNYLKFALIPIILVLVLILYLLIKKVKKSKK